MELNDNEFDATFRKKVFDGDPQFEEAAWDKMERKLKRRDRIVFFKRSAVVLLALLAGVWGYYSFDRADLKNTETAVRKTGKENGGKAPLKEKIMKDTKQPADTLQSTEGVAVVKGLKNKVTAGYPADRYASKKPPVNPVPANNGVRDEGKDIGQIVAEQPLIAGNEVKDTVRQVEVRKEAVLVPEEMPQEKKIIKRRRGLPVSLAISAGPEFNSASSVVGGDPGFSAGLTFGLGISKRLDLQTGIRYSIKKYNSGGGIRYNFPNTGAWSKNSLTSLEASCYVLEIPLQASYNVVNNGLSSIYLNAGVSSYLMMQEDYIFRYDTPYGNTARTLEKVNANQHFLSVIDLSATYFIKLKSNNLKVGFEPFVKIPLTGVGEGNINLKSSGISLKLRYDLDKKNN